MPREIENCGGGSQNGGRLGGREAKVVEARDKSAKCQPKVRRFFLFDSLFTIFSTYLKKNMYFRCKIIYLTDQARLGAN